METKYSKEQVESACKNSKFYKDVALKLSCSESHAGKLIKRFNVEFYPQIGTIEKYTKEQIINFCKDCSSYEDVAKKMGLTIFTVKYYIKKFKIDFTIKSGIPPKYTEEYIKQIFSSASTYEELAKCLGVTRISAYQRSICKKYGFDIPYRKSGCPNKSGRNREREKEISNEQRRVLFEKTSFLDSTFKNVPYQQRTWHIKNNKLELQKCICGNLMKFVEKRYKYCSKKCEFTIRNFKAENTFFRKFGVKNPFQSEKIKNKIRNTCLLKYGVENVGSVSNNFRYKDYMLPSGKIVKIQGYENKALDILLTKYNENDILIGPAFIRRKIGPIRYELNGKIRNYYPDFYIVSINKIIEVKSQWTYNKKGRDLNQQNINELKKQACLNIGLGFEFMIF